MDSADSGNVPEVLKREKDLSKVILTDKVLEERAKEYSQGIKEVSKDSQDSITFIRFMLSKETYLIDIKYMDEITRVGKITRIPNINDSIAGITNVRGNLYLVMNLKILLNLAISEVNSNSRLIFIKDSDFITGFIADEICDVILLDKRLFQEAIVAIKDSQREFIKGLFQYGDVQLIWLDIERIMIEIERRLSEK